ncbi:acetoin utilization protein AcuC [bacterium]|nr:MAG: acetoin utilization protein AcuC [bacterium]
MKTAFIYSEKFGSVVYSPDHPMRPVRLKLTHELMSATNVLNPPSSEIIIARLASEKELLLFHTPEYIKMLKEADTGITPADGPMYGLGFGDNPVFRGVYEWSCYSVGASLQAAELIASGKYDSAFNIAGGLHHAMPSQASGFCYLNDPAVAIKYLVSLGKRVAYVDIDAHHGDGVQHAFYDTDKVLTISLHENGQWLFPGTGFAADTGTKDGKGFSVNLPLPPGTGDELFIKAFHEVVPPFVEAFRPDVLVTQLGVDTFATDPITHLNLTTNGFEEMLCAFKSMGVPWVALGGGGYDLSNVSRAWTLAWAVMNDVMAPEAVPLEFMKANKEIFRTPQLRDKPLESLPIKDEDIKAVYADIAFLKKTALPLVKKAHGKKRFI